MTTPLPTEPSEEILTLANALRPALFHIWRKLRRDSEEDGLGVSPMQNYLLAVIRKHPGIGVSDLARMEKLRGPTISGHIKTLEAAGLMTRTQPQNGDRRRTGLQVTDKGNEMIETLRARRTDWLAQQLSRLTPEARAVLGQAIVPLQEIGQ